MARPPRSRAPPPITPPLPPLGTASAPDLSSPARTTRRQAQPLPYLCVLSADTPFPALGRPSWTNSSIARVSLRCPSAWCVRGGGSKRPHPQCRLSGRPPAHAPLPPSTLPSSPTHAHARPHTFVLPHHPNSPPRPFHHHHPQNRESATVFVVFSGSESDWYKDAVMEAVNQVGSRQGGVRVEVGAVSGCGQCGSSFS